MTQQSKAIRMNARFAQTRWGKLPRLALRALEELTNNYSLSVASGDLLYLDGKWYVTHPGLLRVARRNRCTGIQVKPVQMFCDLQTNRWAFKATVYKGRNCKGFVGYGDADPSNTSPLVHGAEMRVAETRAVNRALRKAYGIGLCSVEELGSFSAPQASIAPPVSNGHARSNGSSNGQPRLRDRLCLLIRQHNLDPALVKAYAADFCGTTCLKDASRDLVESFITQLAVSAEKDRDALVCKLNSYAQLVGAKP
ncbi:MAG: hypothetical protein WCA38_03315 [Candidatus Acidiferrales bacterium]